MTDNTADAAATSDPTANWSFETKQVHAGQTADTATNARALPIYQTTSYVFDSTDHAAALFGLAEPGNIYTRIMNPTQDAVEQRIAALEGGVAALLLSSGQAAETIAILNIAEAGDHIVSSPYLYGGTYNLLHYTLRKLGIEVTFVEDPDKSRAVARSHSPEHEGVSNGETIANPKNHILRPTRYLVTGPRERSSVDRGQRQSRRRTCFAHSNTAPTSSFTSATKYLGGHGTAIAGVIVDGGTFRSGRRVATRTSRRLIPATTASPSRTSARRRSHSRPASNCCAISVPPWRRSTRSSSRRVSKP